MDTRLALKDDASAFSKDLKLYEVMLMSREAENRESILFRQGRGRFHLPGAGHEAMACIAQFITKNDWVYPYYRDRAFMLAMGVPLLEIAQGFFGHEDSSSGGRQMPSHFSHAPLNIASCATPTGLQCLPAAGTAWAIKKSKKNNVVFCSIGDASTRQGEFYESVCFAIQENLPIIYLVEDNDFGISTPTANMTPLYLSALPMDRVKIMDGTSTASLEKDMGGLIEDVRNGAGPQIAWIKLDRLMSHTSSDDQRKYRSVEDIENMMKRDPVARLRASLSEHLVSGEMDRIDAGIKEFVKQTYKDAEESSAPDPDKIRDHIFSSEANLGWQNKFSACDAGMGEAVNLALGEILKHNDKAVIFGEDVEDPKGGVFGLTKNLSREFPDQVHNSPLAEATIAGLASGLGKCGFFPIFELQFIDFVGTAFNQIVNEIATLRWRTKGQFKCPLILYAPCGAYLQSGGPWHSQTNESWFAHAPGLKIYYPSNAQDAFQLFLHASQGDDPVLILLPKNQFQAVSRIEPTLELMPERARILKSGSDITIVAWGNCVSLSMAAADMLGAANISCEVLDLRTITPCDWNSLYRSVEKTGRLVVVQEDNRTCSFGQAIISQLIENPELWESLYSAPQLVTREDVHIGYHADLECAVLPDLNLIIKKCYQVLGRKI